MQKNVCGPYPNSTTLCVPFGKHIHFWCPRTVIWVKVGNVMKFRIGYGA